GVLFEAKTIAVIRDQRFYRKITPGASQTGEENDSCDPFKWFGFVYPSTPSILCFTSIRMRRLSRSPMASSTLKRIKQIIEMTMNWKECTRGTRERIVFLVSVGISPMKVAMTMEIIAKMQVSRRRKMRGKGRESGRGGGGI
ncbi:hypothetical protein PENTCL1PPCAC_4389, partial [Pristionchus entomophagus]